MKSKRVLSLILAVSMLADNLPAWSATQRSEGVVSSAGGQRAVVNDLTLKNFDTVSGEASTLNLDLGAIQPRGDVNELPVDASLRLDSGLPGATLRSSILLDRRNKDDANSTGGSSSITSQATARETVAAMAMGIDQGAVSSSLNRAYSGQAARPENGDESTPAVHAMTGDSLGGDGSDQNRNGGADGNGGSSDDGRGPKAKKAPGANAVRKLEFDPKAKIGADDQRILMEAFGDRPNAARIGSFLRSAGFDPRKTDVVVLNTQVISEGPVFNQETDRQGYELLIRQGRKSIHAEVSVGFADGDLTIKEKKGENPRVSSPADQEQPALHLRAASDATGHSDAQFIGASAHLRNKSNIWGYTFFSPSAKEFVSVNVNFLGKATVTNRYPARDIIPAKPIDLSPTSQEKIIPLSKALAAAKRESGFDPVTVNLGRDYHGKAIYTFTAMGDQRVIVNATSGDVEEYRNKATNGLAAAGPKMTIAPFGMIAAMGRMDPRYGQTADELQKILRARGLAAKVELDTSWSGKAGVPPLVKGLLLTLNDLNDTAKIWDLFQGDSVAKWTYHATAGGLNRDLKVNVHQAPVSLAPRFVFRFRGIRAPFPEELVALKQKVQAAGGTIVDETSWMLLVEGDESALSALAKGSWTMTPEHRNFTQNPDGEPPMPKAVAGIRAMAARLGVAASVGIEPHVPAWMGEGAKHIDVEGTQGPLMEGAFQLTIANDKGAKAVFQVPDAMSRHRLGVKTTVEFVNTDGLTIGPVSIDDVKQFDPHGLAALADAAIPDSFRGRQLDATKAVLESLKSPLTRDQISLPADALFAAAKKLKPMTGPGYSTKGRLRGTLIAGPAAGMDSMTVELEIDGKTVPVDNAKAIFDAVRKARPQQVHYYEFDGMVDITAIVSEWAAPFKTTVNATLAIGYAGARRSQWVLSERGISPIFTQAMKDRLAADPRIKIVNSSLMRVTVEAEEDALKPYEDALSIVRVASEQEKTEITGRTPHPVGALPPDVERQRKAAIESYLKSKGLKDFEVKLSADAPSHIAGPTNVATIKTGPQHAFRVGQIYNEIQDGIRSGKLKVGVEIWEFVAGDRVFRDRMPQGVPVLDAAKAQEIVGKLKDAEIATYSLPTGVPPFAGAQRFGHVKIAELKPEDLGPGRWVLHQRGDDGSTAARDYYLEWAGAVAFSLSAEVERHAQRLADRHAEIVQAQAATGDETFVAAPAMSGPARKTVPISRDHDHYHQYTGKSGAAVLRKNEDSGNGVSYRTAGGLEVPLDGSKKYADLVRSGALTMYQVRTQDDDGEGHRVWDTSYVLAVRGTSRLRRYQQRLDWLIENGRAAWDKQQHAVDALHNVIHAARIVSGNPDAAQMAKIKEEVKAALAKYSEIERAYRREYARWQAQVRDLKAEIKNPAMQTLVADALAASDPRSYDAFHWKDQAKWIAAVLAIDPAIYDKQEIRYVDPGGLGDVRIGLDVKPIIDAGGTAAGLADRLKAQIDELLKQKKIDAKVSVELLYGNHELDHSLMSISQKLAREIVVPVIGADAIRGFGSSSYDSDPKGWWEIRVKPESAQAAKALLPRIKAEMARYGFRSFAKNIVIATQNDQGAITEDEKMPAGNSAAGWGFDAEDPAPAQAVRTSPPNPSPAPTEIVEFAKALASRPGKTDRREAADHTKHGVSMSADGKSMLFGIEEPVPNSVLARVISIGVNIESGRVWGSMGMRNTAGGPSPKFIAKLSDQEANRRLSAEMNAWTTYWTTPQGESVEALKTALDAHVADFLGDEGLNPRHDEDWAQIRTIAHQIQIRIVKAGEASDASKFSVLYDALRQWTAARAQVDEHRAGSFASFKSNVVAFRQALSGQIAQAQDEQAFAKDGAIHRWISEQTRAASQPPAQP